MRSMPAAHGPCVPVGGGGPGGAGGVEGGGTGSRDVDVPSGLWSGLFAFALPSFDMVPIEVLGALCCRGRSPGASVNPKKVANEIALIIGLWRNKTSTSTSKCGRG